MAGLLNLKVTGTKKLIKGMGKATKGLENMRPANLAAAIEYEKWIKKNFQAKGGLHEDGGLSWKPLAESTKAAKRKMGRNPNAILIGRTRNLMMRWNITANNKFSKIKSSVFYSYNHEHGRGVPKRKIFPKDKQGRKITRPVYRLFVKKLIKF